MKISKITFKFIKYFILIITIVVMLCFIASSIFLSKFFITMEYNSLKYSAQEIYSSLKKDPGNIDISTTSPVSNAILIKNDLVTPLTHSKMGMMPFLKSFDYNNLQEKGKFKNPMNEEFLYYKYPTALGDIVVLKSNKFSSDYLHVVYVLLLLVFIIAILLSLPLISYMGKKFTKPILKLQKASHDISQGNFHTNFTVNTKDEIEDLSNSLQYMASSLEEKNALQRNFIANVSHDFKTPLSIIRSYSEAIYDNIINEEEKKVYSNEIISEVDRLNFLVMDLLELSKLQSGLDIIKKEYFNLNEFFTSLKHAYNVMLKNKNINLIINSPNIEIYGDSKYLYRVLYNFIDNAIKFSADSSEIKVSAIENENDIEISVTDHGIGIDKDMLVDVWTRYYKHSKSGGMGLGLAICSEILNMHGYKYGVISIPNIETKFYFIVPKISIH